MLHRQRSSKGKSRSRSPYRKPRDRSKSPNHQQRRHRHRRPNHTANENDPQKLAQQHERALTLPYGARTLSKNDYDKYEALFAQYLELQKQVTLAHIPRDEARGRWKSFLKKWNLGQLAEGWYDPEMLYKSHLSLSDVPETSSRSETKSKQGQQLENVHYGSSTDDEPGPYAGPAQGRGKPLHDRPGPSIPSLQDLELQKEEAAGEAETALSELRRERRANRALEKERLDDLAPKAMAGTKERQMEKRREQASSNRAFADAKAGGDMAEVNENDLLGGGDESMANYKRQLKERERKKSEREVQREETMRARQEERRQRAREIQEREDKTMESLIQLAKQRFG